jgi:hypothetical protein
VEVVFVKSGENRSEIQRKIEGNKVRQSKWIGVIVIDEDRKGKVSETKSSSEGQGKARKNR